jgi:hypothetical protein
MYQIGHSPQISSELALIVRFGYFSFQYFSKDDPTMETKALSTKEDPIGVHKVFAFSKSTHIGTVLCLVPDALLSLSSLLRRKMHRHFKGGDILRAKVAVSTDSPVNTTNQSGLPILNHSRCIRAFFRQENHASISRPG